MIELELLEFSYGPCHDIPGEITVSVVDFSSGEVKLWRIPDTSLSMSISTVSL